MFGVRDLEMSAEVGYAKEDVRPLLLLEDGNGADLTYIKAARAPQASGTSFSTTSKSSHWTGRRSTPDRYNE